MWVSSGKKCLFLIKTVLNGGIRAISFRKKKRIKPGNVLIEILLSRDSLYCSVFMENDDLHHLQSNLETCKKHFWEKNGFGLYK